MASTGKIDLIACFPRGNDELSTNSIARKAEPLKKLLTSLEEISSKSLSDPEVKTSRGSRTDGADAKVLDLYEDPFAEVKFTVELKEARKPGEILNKILRKWFSTPSPDLDAWIVVEDDYAVSTLSKGKNLMLETKVESISFGWLHKLCDFYPEVDLSKKAKGISNIKAIFNHVNNVLTLEFDYEHSCDDFSQAKDGSKRNKHRLEIEYSAVIRSIVNLDLGNKTTELFLRLEKCSIAKRNRTYDEKSFFRTNIIGCAQSECGFHIFSVALAACNVVKIAIPGDQYLLETFFQRHSHERFAACMRTRPQIPRKTVKKVWEKFDLLLIWNRTISFRSAYAIEACRLLTVDFVRQMALMTEQELDEFIGTLKVLADPKTSKLFEDTMFHLSVAIDRGRVLSFVQAIPEQMSKLERDRRVRGNHRFKIGQDEKTMQGTQIIHKVIITPSRIILRPPEEHGENRMLRENNPEYMLRVIFRDDNLRQLSNTLKGYHPDRQRIIDNVVKCHLADGISILDRKFEFLAASSSQLRDHGCWYYAKDDKGRTAIQIRSTMGNFDDIGSVGKRMARQGQCFSSTIQTVAVANEEVRVVPDITGGKHPQSKKPYTFSDGIGKISTQLRDEVCEALNESLKGRKPSAFQVRFRGAKGMVALDPTLEGRCLVLRKSMIKFECDTADKFEVIKCSEERNVTLNRQLITLLEQLGVAPDVFTYYQDKNIFDFTNALLYEEEAALRLKAHVRPEPDSRMDFEGCRDFGISLVRDPYFRAMLLALYGGFITNLRTKSRIAIPWAFGRNLLGVMDETGILEYGQVYLRYTCRDESPKKTTNDRKPVENSSEQRTLTGKVMVTKNPCIHPGDVRMFTAVDVPQLSHLVDVLVFPQNGPRPHPDEMAGSDLDGDEYVAIWDDRFFFKCRCPECKGRSPDGNHPAMIFPDGAAVPEADIRESDYHDFFCKYILSDNVGEMSNAHLAWADSNGIFSRECIGLAHKISVGLDSAKSGGNAELKEHRNKEYPDFMEKQTHKYTYKSKRVLGHLYRSCRVLENSVLQDALARSDSKYVDETFILPEEDCMESYRVAARDLISEYDHRLRKIITNTGVATEAEVMAGLVIFSGKYQTRNFHDIEELQEQLLRQRSFLYKIMREKFDDIVTEKLTEPEPEPKYMCEARFSSAIYEIVHRPGQNDPSTIFRGLPWIFAESLLECKGINRELDNEWATLPSCPVAEELSKSIEESTASFEGLDSASKAFICLIQWARATGLASEDAGEDGKVEKLCIACLKNIFEADPREPTTSPGEHVLNFLQFCATRLVSKLEDIPSCGDCLIGQNNVEVAREVSLCAMKLYSDLAVSGDTAVMIAPDVKRWALRGRSTIVLSVRKTENIEYISDNKHLVIAVLKKWCQADDDDEIAFKIDSRTKYLVLKAVVTAREATRFKLESLVQSYGLNGEIDFMKEIETEVLAMKKAMELQ